jgi:histidine kinase-like protein
MTRTPEPSRTQAAPGDAQAWPLLAGLGPVGALPTVPRLARAFAGMALAGWGLGRLADDCDVVISELTTNAFRAATGPDGQPRYDMHGRLPVLWLRLLSDRTWLRLEVWDNLAPELGVPIERRAAATDESGRGLELVSALSQDWGWDVLPGNDAKRVWAVLA